MGGLFIGPANRDERAGVAFEDMGYGRGQHFAAGSWRVSSYPGPQEDVVPALACGDGFIALAGTIIFRGARNRAALAAIYVAYNGAPDILDDALGHFALAIYKAGKLSVFTDRAGAFKLFIADDAKTVSSSFLAAARGVASPRLDHQAVYEYALAGTVLGDASLIEQVRTLPLRAIAHFEADGIRIGTPPFHAPQLSTASRADLLDMADMALQRTFAGIVEGFGEHITCALTAGYDSRLIVGHLRRLGVTPRLITYGPAGPETRLARAIADAEGMPLRIKDLRPAPVAPEDFPAVVARNFTGFDGYDNQGLFHPTLELEEKRKRSGRDGAFIHGGGGEIFRNFFLLPNRAHSARDLVWAMYGKFDPAVCAPTFDQRGYEDGIVAKITALTGGVARKLGRATIEALYTHFRCRSWFGRESSINNAVGASLMPFYERAVTDLTATIPVIHKANGHFQADLIALADAKLARHTSQYGHNFLGKPPLKRRLKESGKVALPPRLRPLLYAARSRLRSVASPIYLSPPYVERVLGREPHPVVRLFNVEGIKDPLIKSRVLSVAYLAARLDA